MLADDTSAAAAADKFSTLSNDVFASFGRLSEENMRYEDN
jgi:hypothetical protein